MYSASHYFLMSPETRQPLWLASLGRNEKTEKKNENSCFTSEKPGL